MNNHERQCSACHAKILVKLFVLFCWVVAGRCYGVEEPKWLAGTKPLTMEGDLSSQMVAGIDKFLMQEIARSVNERTNLWKRDFSSVEAYDKSVEGNREHLRKMIGAVDERMPAKTLELVSSSTVPSKIAETKTFTVEVVRWPVLEGVFGEG